MTLGQDRAALAAYDEAVNLGIEGHVTKTANSKSKPNAKQLAVAKDRFLESRQNRGILHKRLEDYVSAIVDLEGEVIARVECGGCCCRFILFFFFIFCFPLFFAPPVW